MDPSSPKIKEYEDALTKWLNARRIYPSLNHGPEPALRDYHFRGPLHEWQGQQIRKRIMREMERTE